MSPSRRLLSAIFTALPGFVFCLLFLLTGWRGEYWWGMYLVVLTVLLISSGFFGLMFPFVFQKLRWRPWVWILVQGLLAWTIAYLVLALLNMTPLCVGQNNGDGNNNFGMCMFMTVLSGIVYTPVYFGLLVISALAGSWAIRADRRTNL
jgi:hypothetical protein